MTDVPLSLRPAEEDDCAIIFEWANDPVTRRNSFAPDPISWDIHRDWFRKLLADRNRLLYVALASRERIGQIRFDRCGQREAEVSVALAPAWRGRGLAAPVIQLGSEEAARAGFEVLYAYIKPDNEASRRAFLRAGYVGPLETRRKGLLAVRLTRS
jgi:RimJ/RimL family protein N-acetyltransferase